MVFQLSEFMDFFSPKISLSLSLFLSLSLSRTFVIRAVPKPPS